MPNYDISRLALRAAFPNNDIICDKNGQPSVMVRIPKFRMNEVIEGGSSAVHPAFIVDGTEIPEIYVSKYQNVLFGGLAYSVPCASPAINVTFSSAVSACANKGSGWHLMSNAEWGAIALWCRKHSLLPKGNNSYGKDLSESSYAAIPAAYNTGVFPPLATTVLTGTGPLSWYHDAQRSGIADLNGNVAEWVGGLRTYNGEIQIIPNNDIASGVSQSSSSSAWKALLSDGSTVSPGTAATLKWDYTSDIGTSQSSHPFRLNDTMINDASNTTAYGSNAFTSLEAYGSVAVPEILISLGLMPADTGDHGGCMCSVRTKGERYFTRGGHYASNSNTGLFSFDGTYSRSQVSGKVGFRCCYVPL